MREPGACQDLHAGNIPRLGGWVLYLTGLVGLSTLSNSLNDADARILWSLWACLSAVALIGGYEDIKRTLPPISRYTSTAAAAFWFSIANGGLGITAIGVPGIDWLLQWKLIHVAFFVFAVTGSTHAFNLIDGQNGLSSGASLITYLAIAYLASLLNQDFIAQFAMILACANLGFLVFNYPFGKVFLGDCGAYTNGAMIACLLVLLIEGNEAISPWFAFMVLIYPVTETCFSMYRRLRNRQSIFLADAMHLHHLYYKTDKNSTGLLRFSAAPRFLAISVASNVLAVCFYNNSAILILASFLFIAFYITLYASVSKRMEGAGNNVT